MMSVASFESPEQSGASRVIPLEIEDVHKSFDSEPVLNGASLRLQPGTITGLLGRNGSGKTTLLRSVVGLLKPDSGSIKLFGCESWDSPMEIRQRVGYVPQRFEDLGWLTVQNALNLVGNCYGDWNYERIDEWIATWQIPLNKKIRTLSQGQKQVVAILLAIGHDPDLLVLDEPVSAMDPVARQEFLRVLLMLNQEVNQTILFSSHITTDVERVAADIAMLHRGAIIYQGRLDDLKETVQCLFVRADGPWDESLITGLIGTRVDGNRRQAWVRGWDETMANELGKQLGLPVTLQSIGVEDIFMGMTS